MVPLMPKLAMSKTAESDTTKSTSLRIQRTGGFDWSATKAAATPAKNLLDTAFAMPLLPGAKNGQFCDWALSPGTLSSPSAALNASSTMESSNAGLRWTFGEIKTLRMKLRMVDCDDAERSLARSASTVVAGKAPAPAPEKSA